MQYIYDIMYGRGEILYDGECDSVMFKNTKTYDITVAVRRQR